MRPELATYRRRAAERLGFLRGSLAALARVFGRGKSADVEGYKRACSRATNPDEIGRIGSNPCRIRTRWLKSMTSRLAS